MPGCSLLSRTHSFHHEPLNRYVKLRVAHVPEMMPGTFSPSPRVSDPDMHHGTCMTHVPWCMPGLLTSGFLWSQWQGKRSRHSRRKRKPQFYVSGKRPMVWHSLNDILRNGLHRHFINISISNYFSTWMKYSFTLSLINFENSISSQGDHQK